MLEAITSTLVRLNSNFGVGTMLGVVLDSDHKGGTVTRQRTSCEPETRRFRFNIATNTVYFAGHQRNINR